MSRMKLVHGRGGMLYQCEECLCHMNIDDADGHKCPTGKKQFMLNYNVNLIHTIWIDADTEEEAKEIFEYLYDNHQDTMPEDCDIDHEVTDVFEVPRRFEGLNTWVSR